MRVCILTAGTGSRLGEKTAYLNKSLIDIAGKPALTRSIEMFPPDTEFVIALGYRGDLVREYLLQAHPNKVFYFAEVSPFEGNGSGLGLSLLCCREYLRQSFIFISCDTLVEEPIPAPDENWMGWSDREDISQYRTLALNKDLVTNIQEKLQGDPATSKPYIGLAGITDHEAFWLAMENGGENAITQGEAYGLRALLANGKCIRGHKCTWHDTGNLKNLEATRRAFAKADDPNILEKPDEAIWFVDGSVIKYSNNTHFIRDRAQRAKLLEGFVPQISGTTEHMYKYPMAEGAVFSRAVTLPLFEKLLDQCRIFWKHVDLDADTTAKFQDTCDAFYHSKTVKRIELFYDRFQRTDGATVINGRVLPPLADILEKVNWASLSNGLPGRFHGDFHFENILWSEKGQRFVFLDWRQDFGGRQDYGDIYYDLAKLLHGLIVNHGLIARGEFTVDWKDGKITYDVLRRHVLVECQRFFDHWLEAEGYDREKVYLLTALIYLNIAALHHYPYSLLLYALGKEMLAERCL